MKESLGYKFLNIKTNQFALLDTDIEKIGNTLQVKNSYSYGIEPETGIFTCILSCTYSHDDSILMKIETQAIYQLNEVSMKRFLKGDHFIMPTEVVKHFTSMLYGATRGILVCKLEGTKFASIILPPLDLGKTINKPLELPLN